MLTPTDYLYAVTGEWVRIEGNIATVGISHYTQEELGDVTLLLLPEVGRIVQQGEKFGEIESIQAVSELYAPVSGQVIDSNDALIEAPKKVNDAPYGEGWMIKIRMSGAFDISLLSSSTEYDALMIKPNSSEKEIVGAGF